MSTRDLATRLAVLTAVKQRVTAAEIACRHALDEQMHKDATKGSYVLLGETPLGEVVRVKGRTSVSVHDPNALLEWVREHHPSEVQTLERIRPAFEASLLGRAKRDGVLVDDEGTYIPGVTVTTADPTIRYTPTLDAPEAIERAWQAGAIDLRDLLALPRGESVD